MSKGVKKALGFIAAIAIPFIAAPIAGALAGVQGLGWMSGVAGQALVGAGLGAANAALTGGDIGRGALFGGIGAGVSGLMQGAPIFGQTGTAAMPGVDVAAMGGAAYPTAAMPGVVDVSAAAYPAGTVATPGLTAAAATPTATNFLDAVAQVPSVIAQQLTDPAKLADFTLRAGAMLIPGLMTQDPMAGISDEEKQLVEMRKNELLEIQRTNTDLFNRQLALANDVINEAKQFNPQYFAQQQAKEQQIRGGEMIQQAEETYGQGQQAALEAEKRRINLGVGRGMASAYGEGLARGEGIKQQRLAAGFNMMPRQAPGGAYGSMLDLYQPYKEQSAQQQAGLQATTMDFITRLGLTTPPPKTGKSKAPAPLNKSSTSSSQPTGLYKPGTSFR